MHCSCFYCYYYYYSVHSIPNLQKEGKIVPLLFKRNFYTAKAAWVTSLKTIFLPKFNEQEGASQTGAPAPWKKKVFD